jgi:NADPH-dependent 2,4-dienoyl-CoA reductase/sulfur reductase-like enzyme/rhodanese-related sulfurtransferase
MKVFIIGGVAGGASCAARLRRLSEENEITIIDRGPYVSFANCGLPYYVGDVIDDESDLIVATPALFKDRYNIDVRLENEVLKIDKKNKKIEIRDLKTKQIYEESYDALVLSPGAAPIRPPLPGIDLPGIFVLRTIPDSRNIKNWIEKQNVKSAAIIGGGFIGLEMAENLVGLGIKVDILEMLPQVMPPLDAEMAELIHRELKDKGVNLHLGDAVAEFEKSKENSLIVKTKSEKKHEVDMVILSIGVRPESKLAVEAGLEIGKRGGIQVNEFLQTSDAHVWAIGDAIEVCDFISQEKGLIPLAGPANRQGRIAAENIMGRKSIFRGVQATAVCKVFDLTVALTGLSEKSLVRLGEKFKKIYLHPGHHASYYPDANTIHMKLLFSPDDGRILGAQAIGKDGAEKRIDVLSMAIQKGATVFDLEEAELCYAPQFGSAKDPINMAGMIAGNMLRGDCPMQSWEEIKDKAAFLLDVRTKEEFDQEHLGESVNIPLNELRFKLELLSKDQPIMVFCSAGQRGYFATQILRGHGFDAINLTGGLQTYKMLYPTVCLKA